MQISLILDIVRTLIIVIGILFTIVQLRLAFRQREREMALKLLQSYQTKDFQIAVSKVVELKKGLSKNEMECILKEDMNSILVLLGTFEALGVLVHKKHIKLELVEDFFSGVIVLAWQKLREYIFYLRTTGNRETYYEWFQWLYEQIEKHEQIQPASPAHVQYRKIRMK